MSALLRFVLFLIFRIQNILEIIQEKENIKATLEMCVRCSGARTQPQPLEAEAGGFQSQGQSEHRTRRSRHRVERSAAWRQSTQAQARAALCSRHIHTACCQAALPGLG